MTTWKGLRRDDSDSGISGTSLELVIQADVDGELTSLYTVDNKKFLVELYRNGVLVWCGYVLPEKYSEPYIAVPYDVSVTASDGLGILKDIPFALTGERTLFDVIKYCCDQTELSLDFVIFSSLTESSMKKDNSVFPQATFDSSAFSGKTCYEVLGILMTSLDAFVTECDGKWYVVRYTDLNKDGYWYSNSGKLQGRYSLASLVLGSVDSSLYPIGNMEFEVEPAYKSVKFISEYETKPSFLQNYDFSGGEKAWSGFEFITREYKGTYFAAMHNTSGSQERYIQQGIDVEKSSESVVVEVKFALAQMLASMNGHAGEDRKFALKVHLSGNGQNYYLTEDGWGTGDRRLEVHGGLQDMFYDKKIGNYVDNFGGDFKIIADGFPVSGRLTITIYNIYIETSGSTTVRASLFLDYVIVTNDCSKGIDVSVSLAEKASTSYEDIDIRLTDVPFIENADKMFYNGLKIAGKFTSAWSCGGKTDSFLYTVLKCTCSRIGFARKQLSGTIQGSMLSPFVLVVDKYSGELFYPVECSLNLLDNEMNCTLKQFMPYVELSGDTTESPRVTNNSASEYRSSGDNEVRVYQSGSGVPMRIKDLSPTELQPDSVIEVDRNNAPKSGKATLQKLLEFVLTTGDVWTKEELQVVEGYILYLGEKIKAGDSDLWAGHHFSDYLNQALRTTDTPEFVAILANYLKSVDFASGLTGYKVGVDSEFETLKLRKWLEAAEYLLNQISLVGDEVILTEGGQIDRVEALENGFYRVILRENSVRTGELKKYDMCMTDFKLETGFRVIKFEITDVVDKGTIIVYPEDPAYPPRSMMTFKRFANPVDKTRQNSIRLSARDQIIEMLSGVDSYNPTAKNRDVLIGRIRDLLPELPHVPEFVRQQASIYLQNAILSGTIIQTSADGISQQRVPCYKGLWSIEKAPFFYYDQVTDGHVRYTCVYEGEKGTTEEPRFDSDVWQVADGDTALNMKMYNSTGSWDFWDRLDILFDASVEVFAGSKPINNLVNEWEWWLDTGDAGFDAAWKADHGSKTDTQHVDGSTLPTNMQTGSPVLLWCRARIYYKGKTSTNEGYLNLN